MFTDKNELGQRLLDYLRDIHEMESTPESCDVDDLLSLISQYAAPHITKQEQKVRSLEQGLWQLIQLHDSFVNEPSEQNALAMKDAVDMFRSAFTTERLQ